MSAPHHIYTYAYVLYANIGSFKDESKNSVNGYINTITTITMTRKIYTLVWPLRDTYTCKYTHGSHQADMLRSIRQG